MRMATVARKSAETDINLELALDGRGDSQIDTGCGFLDHMLTLLAKHARFDLKVFCRGDMHVDAHHTVEDVGICLGRAFAEAIGDKRGVNRYASLALPMDESLVLAAVDLSGRSYLSYSLGIPAEKVGDFDTELGEEFWLAFVRNADITLHIKKISGGNSHHLLEASFKAVARVLRTAVAIDKAFADDIPSTKGAL